jgi:hypothetical protein
MVRFRCQGPNRAPERIACWPISIHAGRFPLRRHGKNSETRIPTACLERHDHRKVRSARKMLTKGAAPTSPFSEFDLETLLKTHIGHILHPKRHLLVPLSTTTGDDSVVSFQRLTMILNRLAAWKAALKRPASAVRSRLWPPHFKSLRVC